MIKPNINSRFLILIILTGFVNINCNSNYRMRKHTKLQNSHESEKENLLKTKGDILNKHIFNDYQTTDQNEEIIGKNFKNKIVILLKPFHKCQKLIKLKDNGNYLKIWDIGYNKKILLFMNNNQKLKFKLQKSDLKEIFIEKILEMPKDLNFKNTYVILKKNYENDYVIYIKKKLKGGRQNFWIGCIMGTCLASFLFISLAIFLVWLFLFPVLCTIGGNGAGLNFETCFRLIKGDKIWDILQIIKSFIV